MSDLEVDIILMSLQLDPELPPPAQCWLLSLLTSPELDTVDTALSSWPRSTPRKEHRSFLVVELQTKVREDFTITEKAPTRAFSWFKAPTSAFTFKTVLRHFANWAPKHCK